MAIKKTRQILLVALALIAFGGIAGGLSLLSVYNKATKIDRSVAKVVVRQYLVAALVERDDQQSSLYICNEPGDLSTVAKLRRDLEAGEARNGYVTQIVISRSIESGGGSTVETEVQLNQGTGTDVRTRIVYFRFRMINQDGWRVCSAEQLPDPSPTAIPTPPTTG